MEINEDDDSHKDMMKQIKEKAKLADAKDREKKTEDKYKDIKMNMKDSKQLDIKDEVEDGKKSSHDKDK